MDPVTTFIILMLAVAVLSLLATRIGMPYPTMMVIGGLVISLLPYFFGSTKNGLQIRPIEIPPNLIFTLFLPPILFGGAWQVSWSEVWTNRRTIVLLAVGLVIFTSAGVAALAMAVVPGFTWPAAFALGAILSPPDAIAVTALTKKLHLPHRINLLLEGESLVNDSCALVIYYFALQAARTGTFSLAKASFAFIYMSAGGVAVGLAVAWVAAEVIRRLRDPLVATILTFLVPYTTYLLCENVLGLSGVLATVAAGLYLGWRSPLIMTPQVRLEGFAIWQFVLFLLTGFVFVMMGLALPTVINHLPDFKLGQLAWWCFLFITGLTVLRMVWVVPSTLVPWYISKKVRRFEQKPSPRHSILLGWMGVRGVVSLAAALYLPTTGMGGQPFPNRDIIIFLVFFVILVALVLQSLATPALVKLLRVHTEEDHEAAERKLRLDVARQALQFLTDLIAATDAFGSHGKDLKAHYEHRIADLESGPVPLPVVAEGIEASHMDLHREVLSVERQAIVEMRANQKITIDMFQRLMADVDAEEMRLAHKV